jgi:hypothetical protein
MSPKRVQMSRQRPWRADNPDAVIVARPSKWGNEFEVWRIRGYDWSAEVYDGERLQMLVKNFATAAEARRAAAEAYRAVILAGRRQWSLPTVDEVRAALAGRDLACWCPLDQPCHADVLLEIANGGAA